MSSDLTLRTPMSKRVRLGRNVGDGGPGQL